MTSQKGMAAGRSGPNAPRKHVVKVQSLRLKFVQRMYGPVIAPRQMPTLISKYVRRLKPVARQFSIQLEGKTMGLSNTSVYNIRVQNS